MLSSLALAAAFVLALLALPALAAWCLSLADRARDRKKAD